MKTKLNLKEEIFCVGIYKSIFTNVHKQHKAEQHKCLFIYRNICDATCMSL